MGVRIHMVSRVYVALSLLYLMWQPLGCLADEVRKDGDMIVSLRAGVTLKEFVQELKSQGHELEVKADMTGTDAMNLLTLHTKSQQDVLMLRDHPMTEKVQPVQRMKLLRPGVHDSFSSNDTVETTSDQFGPHVQTRVAELHKLGHYGEGIKVAVIDSGVDCDHPALGKGYGPGHKIGFGYDLVGDDYDGFGNLKPKPSPCTPCGVHGTHVSGTIGADNVGFGIMGVAPNATLGMYRVIGCNSEAGTTNALVIQAMLKAYADGAHIISASIGGVGGWSIGDTLSDTIEALSKKGLIFVLAAGNEGSEGVFYAESPAASPGVIAVGWVQSSTSVVTGFMTSTGKKLYYHSAARMNGTKLPIYVSDPTLTLDGDSCKPWGPETPALNNTIVLIRRGTCTFIEKIRYAVGKGATRILIYMDGDDIVTLEGKQFDIDIATISKADGLYLAQQAAKDPTGFTVDFPESPRVFATASDAGKINNSSNYGPAYDFKSLQPSLLGVGGNMVSTVPMKQGSYAAMSGSSMATPQIAGIVALVLSIRGKLLDVFQMKALLSTTSQLLPNNIKNDVLESAIHQGAGLVNAYCAALTNTLVSTGYLGLQDLQQFVKMHHFSITNVGSETYSYQLEHKPAQTLASYLPGSKIVSADPLPIEGHPPAHMQSDSQTFELKPGQTRNITVSFTPPTGLNEAQLPIYSGYLRLKTNKECESHTIPYHGVYGKMEAQRPIAYGADTSPFENFKVPRLADGNRTEVKKPFSMVGTDKPVIRYRLNMGSPYITMDLAEGDSVMQSPVVTTMMETDVPLRSYTNVTLNQNTFRGVKLLGRLTESNGTFQPRTARDDTVGQVFDGRINPYSNASSIVDVPDGKYRIVVRVLHIEGEPKYENDWDAWMSDAFTIARAAGHN